MFAKRMFTLLAAVAACGVACAEDVFANATEYFVNPDPEIGSIDYDGTSPTNIPGTLRGPMLRIQDAVDLADGKGTIVTLAPGIYTNGCTLVGSISNRVAITKANVKLRGTSGHRDDTIILGNKDWANDATYGLGPAAVRCVYGRGTDKEDNVIVEGLTLAGGATTAAESPGRGGGAYAVVLIDCVVSNNAATRGGGIYSCKAFRCRLTENISTTKSGSAACQSHLSNSFVARNGVSTALAYMYNVVNCTVADHSVAVLADSANLKIRNTLLINNAYNGFKTVSKGSAAYACVALNGAVGETVDSETVTTGISNHGEVVGPAICDCRILTTSVSYNRGRGEYVNDADILPFPEGYEPRDIDGNLITTNGAVHVGCSQTAVAPAGACFEFEQPCEVAGCGRFAVHTYGYTKINPYLRPTVTGEIFRLRPILSEGAKLFGLYDHDLGSDVSSIYAMYDGTYCFPTRPLRANDASVRVSAISAQNVYYVDGTNGDDDKYDGTSATIISETVGPKKTIMAAIALHTDASKHTIIYVAPGTYAETSGVQQAAVALSVNNLGLVSTVKGGATICGQKDPSTAAGLGADSLRCVLLGGNECFIQGFVLSGGYGPSTDAGSDYAGGGVHCEGSRQFTLDCVITNCTASTGAGQFRGHALRTAFYDNTATAANGSVARYADCFSCLFGGNAGTGALFYYSGNLYFCSVAAGNRQLLEAAESCRVNDVVGVVAEDVSAKGGPCTGLELGLNLDGCFAAPNKGDFRLGCLSPAYGAVPAADIYGLANYVYVSTDINGDDLQLVDGRFTAGAVHNRTPLPCVVVSAGGNSGTTVAGGRVGTNVVTRADQTFTVTADPTRPYCGIRKDGEIVSTANPYEIAAAGVTSNAAYDVVYGTDWYVDQANGSDANGGGTLALAKKHLTTAATLAVSGDTVKVAPGTYGDEDGTMLHSPAFSGTATMPSRLWVKEGVTIESLEGPEKTVILGKQTAGEGNYGLGDDSVRCAVVSKNAKIKGFTLTGGGTRSWGGEKYTTQDDYTGGGVLGQVNSSSTVEDCIVTGNCAAVCGAGYQSRFVRSILMWNKAVTRCGCVRSGRFVGCLIDHNRGSYTIEHFSEFDSCTFGADNRHLTGGNTTSFNYPLVAVKNSAILATKGIYGDNNDNYILASSNSIFIAGTLSVYWNLDEKSTFIDSADACFDGATYRPLLVAGNPALDGVDAESAALSDAEAVGTYDASGFQRVMNGTRDIGALEGDWRGNYAEAITRSPRFAVTAATPLVIRESATAGDVTIQTNAMLAATWKTETVGETYRLTVRAYGTGTLTVTQNDAVVGTATAAEGEKTLTLRSGALTDALEFAYAGADGYGVVRRLSGARGAAIFVK